MAGSEAEERIRAKAEALLRAERPSARVIHELNTSSGGPRLDLAAVDIDRLTLAEIKSERDVLSRLPDQIRAAGKVSGDVRVFAAEKHKTALLDALDEHLRDSEGKAIIEWTELKGGGRQGSMLPNPRYLPELKRCTVYIETDRGFDVLDSSSQWLIERHAQGHIGHPLDLLEMLWAEELRTVLADGGIACPKRASRYVTMRLAALGLTGSQIRRAVHKALLARPFARSDTGVGAAPASSSLFR